jgi:hypothetical protein
LASAIAAAFITIVVTVEVNTQRQTAKRPAQAGLFFWCGGTRCGIESVRAMLRDIFFDRSFS